MPTFRLASDTRRLRRFLAALSMAALSAVVAASARATQEPGQDPAAQEKPAQEKPAQPGGAPQQPTFRTEANFVRVDVYPTAGDRPVQDLQQADFEVFEDGQRQEVRTFEHIVIQPGGPAETRSEPNTVRDSQQMIADPRARLFVLFLDTYHVTREGAWHARRSLSRLLERTISPSDFVALMTPEMGASSMTFTRRTASIDELLDKWVDWGRRFQEHIDPDPVEARYQACYPPESASTRGLSSTAAEMIARRREKLTIDAMRDLVLHLSGLREERKAILMVSEGWALYGPNQNLAKAKNGRVPGPPEVGVGPTGGLRVGDIGRDMSGSRYECEQHRLQLSMEDHDREFRDLLDEANRANASFYTIDPRGLPVFDTPIDAGGANLSPAADMALLRNRQESLHTLAGATDGVAVMNSNDIDKGLKRVVDDLTSYYLLGYYSNNAKADGRFHSISVRVRRPGVSVRARRGYRSPTKEELEAVMRGASGAKAEETPAARALSGLSKLRTNAFVFATAGYDWVPGADGAPTPSLWVALELDPVAGTRDEQWRAGADVSVAVNDADKSPVGEPSSYSLKREARFAFVRVPLPPQLPGDFAVRLTSKPAGATLGSTETLRVTVPRPAGGGPLLGQPRLYRRGPFSGAGWQAVGDVRYRRQERVKVEVAAPSAFDGVDARLLDRNGTPLSNIPVAAATRDENGRKIASAEVTLAPLTTGDYVLELDIRQGDTTHKVLGAFRIIP